MKPPSDDLDARWRDGLVAYARQWGIPADDVAEQMGALLGERVGREAILAAGAGAWDAATLPLRERSLVVIAILMALGGAESRLAIHARSAIQHGATPEELDETAHLVALYAGYARASLGLEAVRGALQSHEPERRKRVDT